MQRPERQALQPEQEQLASEQLVQAPGRQALPEQLEQAREPQASGPEPLEPGLDLQPEREQRA